MTTLFYVSSIIDKMEFRGERHKKVFVRWFSMRPEPISNIDYRDAIVDYEKNKREDVELGYDSYERCELALNEYFTREEAERLKSYLDELKNGVPFAVKETVVEPTTLPIEYNLFPYAHIEPDERRDFMYLDDALPFRVGGYFELKA